MSDDYEAGWWEYGKLTQVNPTDWSPATRGDRPLDQLDFHLDLGCGTVKKGRIGVDRWRAPGVDLMIDLNRLFPMFLPDPRAQFERPRYQSNWEDRKTADTYVEMYDAGVLPRGSWGLPFPDDSIKSIISHHCLEHIGDGFFNLMDECFRVLEPGGVFRIIVPLFPSFTAVADPDHKRYFCEKTFETFCGTPTGEHWHESFSVPYTNCRFEMLDEDISPPTPAEKMWTPDDAREMRVALRKWA